MASSPASPGTSYTIVFLVDPYTKTSLVKWLLQMEVSHTRTLGNEKK